MNDSITLYPTYFFKQALYTDYSIERYHNEVKAYKEVEKYNASHPNDIIHIPKLVAYGINKTKKGNGRIDKLYYIAVEKLDAHHPRTKQELIDGIRELELIKKSGICHDDVHSGNYLHDSKNFYVIDYGEVEFNGPDKRYRAAI
ncbi:unnamed protein product [Ambrosiozyma monospora]|uniref:Unnamed protein product n=1 Tax=Ambrosiozyma monospora TaxID=43982 RepID=A0ACB5SWH4_AMBMO|nr:unnamed protein product [Ambrosiozyma monospora]